MLGNKQAEVLKEGYQYDTSQVPESMKADVEKALKWEGDGFDLRTHIVEPKTGQLLKYQPYRRVVDSSGTYYIRKVNGVARRFNENGALMDSHHNASQTIEPLMHPVQQSKPTINPEPKPTISQKVAEPVRPITAPPVAPHTGENPNFEGKDRPHDKVVSR